MNIIELFEAADTIPPRDDEAIKTSLLNVHALVYRAAERAVNDRGYAPSLTPNQRQNDIDQQISAIVREFDPYLRSWYTLWRTYGCVTLGAWVNTPGSEAATIYQRLSAQLSPAARSSTPLYTAEEYDPRTGLGTRYDEFITPLS